MTNTTNKNITIVGAGVGGLILARILYINGIEAVVFESETSPLSRDEGGMLVMQDEYGVKAIKMAGLLEKYQNIAVRGGDIVRVYDKTGSIRYKEEGIRTHSEVERGELRKMLLESLPKNMVQWGKKVEHVNPLGNGRHEIVCSNGELFNTDILIGADGAWSKIRPVVSNKKPTYSGITYIETQFENVDVKHQNIAELVGNGFMIALSDEKGIVTESKTRNRIIVYFAIKVDKKWIRSTENTLTNISITKSRLLSYFKDWDTKLRTIITESESNFKLLPIYMLPVGHRWKHTPGITLIGDAAHLITPNGAIGANQALLDGVELGKAILSSDGNTEEALIRYENAMFPRSKANIKDAVKIFMTSFKPDGIKRYIDIMDN